MLEINDSQYKKIASDVQDIIISDDQDRAFESIGILKEYLKRQGAEKTNPELFIAYNNLITELKWVALPMLKEDDVIDLFSKDIAATFQMEDFDLWMKLKTVLIAVVGDYQERDKFKERIRSALNKSQAMLSSIKLDNGDSPTVGNWIRSYTASVGLNPVESVKLQGYFLNDSNVKKLKPEEKERVKGFFQFYERLKLSSLTVAGIEEVVPIPIDDDGTMGYIRNGKIERDAPLPPEVQRIFDAVIGVKKAPQESQEVIPKKEPEKIDDGRLAELKKMADSFPVQSLQRKAVEAEIKKISKK
jgi:hypothetical protein